MTSPPLQHGTAVLHLGLLGKTQHLWEGELRPDDLEEIEICLRAFIVSDRLTTIPIDSTIGDADVADSWGTGWSGVDFSKPFEDHLLDYEFFDPSGNLPRVSLEGAEESFLLASVKEKLEEKIRTGMPRDVKSTADAVHHLANWYGSNYWLDEKMFEEEYREQFDPEIFLHKHYFYHKGISYDARLLLELSRTGYTIYGRSKIFEICSDHIFFSWPDKIFSDFGLRYSEFSRAVRGPGTGVALPPITALVLSRARSRHDIPRTIVNMRDEYREYRDELWNLIKELWGVNSPRRQAEILRSLNVLGDAVFDSAFGKKFNALSVGLELAKFSPAGVVGAIGDISKQIEPKAKVSAVSFAQKLSHDLINHMQTNRHILEKHLSKTERKHFGI